MKGVHKVSVLREHRWQRCRLTIQLVKLGALAVYFDTDTGSLDKGAENRQDTLDALKAMLVGKPEHQYILRPVTGEARVRLSRVSRPDA